MIFLWRRHDVRLVRERSLPEFEPHRVDILGVTIHPHEPALGIRLDVLDDRCDDGILVECLEPRRQDRLCFGAFTGARGREFIHGRTVVVTPISAAVHQHSSVR